MTKDEALLMTLATLEEGNFVYPTALRTAIEAALAQPSDSVEQEPVGGLVVVDGEVEEIEAYPNTLSDGVYSLYTAPPKRQPLTDEQIMEIGKELGAKCRLGGNPNIDFDYARAIEAKLKEFNHD